MADDIVITGAAVACSLGNDREEAWSRLLSGRASFGELSALESTPAVPAGGAQCAPLPSDSGSHISEELRESRYLHHVCLAAIAEAGLTAASDRTVGLLLGSTLHGLRGAGRFFRTDEPRHLAAVPAADTLRRIAEALPISIDGPRLTVCSACSSGLLSIGLAATLLRLRLCDVVLAGGYDPISEYAHAGFACLGLVTSVAPAPFCTDRDGLKVSEGYGVVVLERAADAAGRGAPLLGRLAGFGDSSDAHHLTQPHPEGAGATAAMQRALAAAGLSAADLDMVVAHATGTPNNDAAEYAALAPMLAARTAALPVTALKPALGHTLGAAGAVELILTLCALRDGVIPHAAGVDAARLEFPRLDLVCGAPRRATPRRCLNLSLGFGGSNAAAIVEVAERAPALPPSREPASPAREVVITGVGVITPTACDLPTFLSQRAGPAGVPGPDHPRRVDPALYEHLVNARRLRRISECARLSIAASTQALRHAGVADDALWAESAIAISATAAGSVEHSAAYYGEIVERGLAAANPMLFAEGVPNAAAAHISMALKIRGGAFAVIGSRCAGLDAIRLAAARIQAGETARAVVCAAEEHGELIDAAAGTPTSSAAAAVVLEERSEAEARGATSLARLLGGSWGTARPTADRPTHPDSLSTGPVLDLIAALFAPDPGDRTRIEATASDCSGAATTLLLAL